MAKEPETTKLPETEAEWEAYRKNPPKNSLFARWKDADQNTDGLTITRADGTVVKVSELPDQPDRK